MKRVLCSYAYDVPCYWDFVIEVPDHLTDAEAETRAEKMAEEARQEGLFDDKIGNESYENIDNERIFVSGVERASNRADGNPILERLAVPVPNVQKVGKNVVSVGTGKISFNLREGGE